MVVRTLRPRLVGQNITAVETSGLALRRPIDLKMLKRACVGARVDAVRRIGKYWLIDLSTEHVLLGHLGMTGRLVFADADAPRAAHTHAVFRLARGDELRYVDPRRFGVLRAYAAADAAQSAELAVLGVDPLERGFTVRYFADSLAASRRDIKAFLMDQSRVAGLGNIYVCEALFRAGIAPTRRSDRVAKKAEALHAAVVTVLKESIENRGTSFSDYVDADGQSGGNQRSLWVYGREDDPCRRCAGRIKRRVQAGRSTFFCPRCQK
ncbi:MAG: formamidopyrimidine-DNA glycosylase / DNA-(apurinic or apyrimidinic site) lyase [Myxococcales bacterium]|nr:formamidopyrimidine-DNA glycosylase / DNA-(apurinic or apyrimidinic site) lyase [Myxococcales bacterium]